MIIKMFFLIFFGLLSGCSNNGEITCAQKRAQEVQCWKTADGNVKVLTTTAMISDLVERIGSGHIDVLTLITDELNPHSYQLVKGDDEKLARADLIFFNGLGLEHGPSLQHYLQKNSKAIGLGDQIQHQFPKILLQYNGQQDPHIWMDISLWAKTIPFIVEALSVQDPSHAQIYRSNGDLLLTEMLQKHQEIQNQMQSVPANRRYLVTSHDAFNYFARAYLATDEERTNGNWQKRFAAPEGLAPDSQLSAADIKAIMDHVAEFGVTVLFPESNVSKDSIRKIVVAGKEKGLNLRMADTPLYGDAMGCPGSEGDTYLKMIQYNASTLANWWNGER